MHSKRSSVWPCALAAIVATAVSATAAPEIRLPSGVVPYHGPVEVADLVRSRAWPYGRIQLQRVDEVLSVELRRSGQSAAYFWAVLVRGQATFQPPPTGKPSAWEFACVYLDGETLEFLQVQLVARPTADRPLGFDSCTQG